MAGYDALMDSITLHANIRTNGICGNNRTQMDLGQYLAFLIWKISHRHGLLEISPWKKINPSSTTKSTPIIT
jgi:hypothetical protein